MRPLSPDEVAHLSDDELAEYVDLMEGLLRHQQQDRLTTYAESIEVPGTPLPDDVEDKLYPVKLTLASHHRLILDAVQEMAEPPPDLPEDELPEGLIIMMPPGSAKSTMASVVAPSWLLGRKPGTDVIGVSYGSDLAQRFGRRVRTIVRSPDWQKIFGATITGDNQAVDDWTCTNGSAYRAAGLQAGITGRRGDWVFIDDPVKSREQADSKRIRDKVWDEFKDSVETRLKPGGRIVIIMTRWHADDLAGRLLGETWAGQSGKWKGTDGRLWRVICLPMIAEHEDDPLGRKPGALLWPEWFRQREVDRIRSSNARTWSALYQQRPTLAEGAILQRSLWKPWGQLEKGADGKWHNTKAPPECQFVLLSYDTALEDGQDNDYSAMSMWGIFTRLIKLSDGREVEQPNAILLGAWQEKIKAADLVGRVRQHRERLDPDLILIEQKASGIQLIQELRRLRLPVKAWLPKGPPGTRGKVPRAHAVAYLLEQGCIWYYPIHPTRAETTPEDVIDQCAAVPYGQHDDLADTTTQALSWLRSKLLLALPSDEPTPEEVREAEEDEIRAQGKQRKLYGSRATSSREGRRTLYGGRPTKGVQAV